ncbi:hypothetical protein EYF80_029799 [Liparis tanakae]|uniref:Uncharacterized protein n=1 Tax=Liparis tanakae TaxID=230148 RepID=A0A4Z2H241_9TELE|nr:hypothetical protein EYF80_029799 [Liparis tanakae]
MTGERLTQSPQEPTGAAGHSQADRPLQEVTRAFPYNSNLYKAAVHELHHTTLRDSFKFHINCLSNPELGLGWDTGAELALVCGRLDHHTSADKQMLHIWHAVKGDVDFPLYPAHGLPSGENIHVVLELYYLSDSENASSSLDLISSSCLAQS